MIFSPTRADIQAAARNCLEDANTGRTWKNWQVNQSINNTLSYLHAEIFKLDKGWFERVCSLGITAGVAVYTLPSDVGKIKSVEYVVNGTTTRALQRAWSTQLLRSTHQGEPLYYFFLGRRQIGIYPVPKATQAYVNAQDGPIRVTYIEKLPRFVELDHPVAFREHTIISDPAGLSMEYQGMDIAHQNMQGPAISAVLEQVEDDVTFIPYRYFRLIALFVRRDSTKSRYSPPSQIGMPWCSGTFKQTIPDEDSFKLQITDWPQGDPDNTEWPEDATHLDLWLYVSGNPDQAVMSGYSGNNYHDMVFLGNILPEDAVSSGPITFTALGGNTVPFGPGEEGPAIWDGRNVSTIVPAGTGVELFGGFSDTDLMSRWIHQIPPTPYQFNYRWAPYDTSNVYASAPNTGTGVYFDTNPARGDGDILHEDFTDEHIEIFGVGAALNTVLRHGLFNKVLMARFDDLMRAFKDTFASRDSTPRTVNITNPDPNQIAVGHDNLVSKLRR